MRWKSHTNLLFVSTGLIVVAGFLGGCGSFFGAAAEATATPGEARQLVPTFTPTAVPPVQLVATNTTAPAEPPTVVPTETIPPAVVNTATIAPTDTPAAKAQVVVEQDLVNVRLGPGIDYGLAGEVTKGQTFDVIGKNQQGDWWQICCVNGQQVWIFGALARAENTAAVQVVTDLPPKPVAQAPTPAPQPTPTPEPQVQAPPPPAADPCANIGGDGCKFKIRGGPKFQANGGNELKLQLMFMHSGDGGRPQGSYFVAMFKDGQKLPIDDRTRSQVDIRQQGQLGNYNYEYKLNLSQIPGSNVAGAYVLYVLDGNGERDSQDFTFSVPEGQGEIWIEFDQGL
jgi:hypothetical protein